MEFHFFAECYKVSQFRLLILIFSSNGEKRELKKVSCSTFKIILRDLSFFSILQKIGLRTFNAYYIAFAAVISTIALIIHNRRRQLNVSIL